MVTSESCYKAKLTGETTWVKGYFVAGSDVNEAYIVGNIYDGQKPSAIYEIQYDTLCRCSGLKDNEGMFIYQNDVLKIADDDHELYALVEYGKYFNNDDITDELLLGWYLSSGNIKKTILELKSYMTEQGEWILKYAKVVGNICNDPALVELLSEV